MKKNKKLVEVELSLNKEEVIANFPDGFNFKDPMKQVQKFCVNDELKKIAYSEQSPKRSLDALKNGQKKGNPSIRTTGMHESIKNELKNGSKVKVIIESVEPPKTPKDQADEEIKKYKNDNGGKAPEWNKQANRTKWK